MYRERGKLWISVNTKEWITQEKNSKHIVRLYLIKDSNELNIIADYMENRLGLRYKTSLINWHQKIQVFDAVCNSTVNLDFQRIQP